MLREAVSSAQYPRPREEPEILSLYEKASGAYRCRWGSWMYMRFYVLRCFLRLVTCSVAGSVRFFTWAEAVAAFVSWSFK